MQRGNAAGVLGTVPVLDDILYLYLVLYFIVHLFVCYSLVKSSTMKKTKLSVNKRIICPLADSVFRVSRLHRFYIVCAFIPVWYMNVVYEHASGRMNTARLSMTPLPEHSSQQTFQLQKNLQEFWLNSEHERLDSLIFLPRRKDSGCDGDLSIGTFVCVEVSGLRRSGGIDGPAQKLNLANVNLPNSQLNSTNCVLEFGRVRWAGHLSFISDLAHNISVKSDDKDDTFLFLFQRLCACALSLHFCNLKYFRTKMKYVNTHAPMQPR